MGNMCISPLGFVARAKIQYSAFVDSVCRLIHPRQPSEVLVAPRRAYLAFYNVYVYLFRFSVDSFLRIWWLFTSRCASTPKLALAARHTQNRLRYSRYVPVVSSCTVRYSHILFRIIVLCFFPPSSCYIESIPSTFRTCRTDCNFFCLSIYLSHYSTIVPFVLLVWTINNFHWNLFLQIGPFCSVATGVL
jgi:hypothetical protein